MDKQVLTVINEIKQYKQKVKASTGRDLQIVHIRKTQAQVLRGAVKKMRDKLSEGEHLPREVDGLRTDLTACAGVRLVFMDY